MLVKLEIFLIPEILLKNEFKNKVTWMKMKSVVDLFKKKIEPSAHNFIHFHLIFWRTAIPN
jgi:hypothetical protein